MTENKSIICPSCSEKNNPSFNQCWKCRHWFATPTPEMLSHAQKQNDFSFGACLMGLFFGFVGVPLLVWVAIMLHLITSKTSGAIGLFALFSMVVFPILISSKRKGEDAVLLSSFVIGAALVLLFTSACGQMCGFYH